MVTTKKRGPRRFDGIPYQYDSRKLSGGPFEKRIAQLKKSGYRYRTVSRGSHDYAPEGQKMDFRTTYDIYKRKK